MHVLDSSLVVGSGLPKTVAKGFKALRGVRVKDVAFRGSLVAVTPPGTFSDVVVISTILNVSFVNLFSRIHVCPGSGGVIFPGDSAPLPSCKHGLVGISHTLGLGTRTGNRALVLRFSAKGDATKLFCRCCRGRGTRFRDVNGGRGVANNKFGRIIAGSVLHLPSFSVRVKSTATRLGGLTISVAPGNVPTRSSKGVNVSVVGRFSYMAVGLGSVFLGLR